MRPVVKKDELLAILEENRTKHREVFLAALNGFHREAKKQLAAMVEQVTAGINTSVRIYLEAPRDHTSDYDRAIRMVQMHQSATIQLSEEDVAQYVQDDWGWKGAWLKNSSTYAAAKVSEFYEEATDY